MPLRLCPEGAHRAFTLQMSQRRHRYSHFARTLPRGTSGCRKITKASTGLLLLREARLERQGTKEGNQSEVLESSGTSAKFPRPGVPRLPFLFNLILENREQVNGAPPAVSECLPCGQLERSSFRSCAGHSRSQVPFLLSFWGRGLMAERIEWQERR